MAASEKLSAVTTSPLQDLKSFEWGELTDFNTVGQWPGVIKFLIGLVLFAMVIGAGIWFHIKGMNAQLNGVIAQEETKKRDYESKAVLAVNLDVYKNQMQQMEAAFADLLGQLPADTEVPGLLEDITDTGTTSGLEFSTIQPGSEIPQEFYIELPINMNMSGNFHDFGTFVSGVASLDRIVTLHDFTISKSNRGSLDMSITAKTYRYNDAGN